jgi:hypothetical protein
VVSNANNDEQFDADTVQRKADVLRARDIIPGSPTRDEGRLGTPPPYKNVTGQEPDSQQTGKNEPHPPAEQRTSLETEQQTSEIPKFDLAEEIMVEQRRITATRRKAPGEKDGDHRQEREAESAGYAIGQPSPALSEQEQIIAEIVARDIKRLCRSGTSSLRNW